MIIKNSFPRYKANKSEISLFLIGTNRKVFFFSGWLAKEALLPTHFLYVLTFFEKL